MTPQNESIQKSLPRSSTLIPANIIRTETVLSKLPIHNLSKKGSINIQITRKGKDGEVELSWKVSPSRDHGEPRQLAYKVDTLIVNRKIDQERRPLPSVISLGSIRQICRDLGMNEGKGSKDIKNAILQNSSAYISAKLTYKSNDGNIRQLDANFTRYSVIFTGEKLPDGRTADGVYLLLNDPYRELLNYAPVRPLNYDYLRELCPTEQRFYEIVSYKIFAAFKFRRAEAKMPYSEYCTYSAQKRHLDYDHFKKQMYKVHRPHIASGYLKSVRFQATIDSDGTSDWTMFYVPGPKARAEYDCFSNSGRLPEVIVDAIGAPDPQDKSNFSAKKSRRGPRQKRFTFEPRNSAIAHPAIAEMTNRGISLSRAHELLIASNPEVIIDGLEWGDEQIRRSRPGEIRNPAGFYIHLLTESTGPPASFMTSRKQKLLDAAHRMEQQHTYKRMVLEEAYGRYKIEAISNYIQDQHLDSELQRLIVESRKQIRTQWKSIPATTLTELAERRARELIENQVPLLDFEVFCQTRVIPLVPEKNG